MGRFSKQEIATVHPTTTHPTRWAHPTTCHRIRHLRRRFGLSESAARLLAPLIFGEPLQ